MLLNPWPWYVVGPLIGLTVPLLLLIGNKPFGISSTLRHICAACVPAKIPFFQYDWKKDAWNLYFVGGIVLGAFIATYYLSSGAEVIVHEDLKSELAQYGITRYDKLVPQELFSWSALGTFPGFFAIVIGGVLVGFGTRYGNGCTSGHSITGMANLQPASLIATICFMAGGFLMANIILPWIFS